MQIGTSSVWTYKCHTWKVPCWSDAWQKDELTLSMWGIISQCSLSNPKRSMKSIGRCKYGKLSWIKVIDPNLQVSTRKPPLPVVKVIEMNSSHIQVHFWIMFTLLKSFVRPSMNIFLEYAKILIFNCDTNPTATRNTRVHY